jgi:hypothetical protein
MFQMPVHTDRYAFCTLGRGFALISNTDLKRLSAETAGQKEVPLVTKSNLTTAALNATFVHKVPRLSL